MFDVYVRTVHTEYTYAATYFTSHFATPSDIVLTYSVTPVNVTARVDFNSSDGSAVASASVMASEGYSVR